MNREIEDSLVRGEENTSMVARWIGCVMLVMGIGAFFYADFAGVLHRGGWIGGLFFSLGGLGTVMSNLGEDDQIKKQRLRIRELEDELNKIKDVEFLKCFGQRKHTLYAARQVDATDDDDEKMLQFRKDALDRPKNPNAYRGSITLD